MPKPNLFLLSLIFLLLIPFLSLAEESITISTYYPSPYGVYREMRAQRIAIGDTYFDGAEVPWEAEDGDGNPIDLNADLVVEGNVGIGTTSPFQKFETIIDPTYFGSVALGQGYSGNTFDPTIKLYRPNGLGAFYATYLETSSIDFSILTGAAAAAKGSETMTPRLTILNGGNVGIGTANPFDILHIAKERTNNGTDNLAQIVISGSGATNDRLLLGYNTMADNGYIQSVHNALGYTNLLLNPNGGNVGIGTTNPRSPFHIFAPGSDMLKLTFTGINPGTCNLYVRSTVCGSGDATIATVGGVNLCMYCNINPF
ncbi:MAG: hypothetical protein PHO03_05320 [Candidatus Omnitrophica bacterium]|nr:hypothetical protein [Candidatus Omnitrophota bacterium]